MSNLFRNLKPETKLHKNGFDLSQRKLYTQVAGELLPSLCIDCVPGDKHVINLSNMVRTMPMNTAAYARIKQYHHFFFVPYSILWSQWDSFITQRKNNISSNAQNSLFVPNFNPKADVGVLTESAKDMFGYSYRRRAPKLLEMLGYGNTYLGEYYEENKYICNVFRLAAYNKIWYDYYRNPYFDNEEVQSRYDYIWSWNFDDCECRNFQSANMRAVESNPRNNTSFLGWMLSPKYRQYKKDMLTSLLPDTQFGAVSYVPVGEEPFMIYNGRNNPGISGEPILTNDVSITKEGNSYKQIGASGLYTDFVAEGLNFNVLTLRKAEALQKWKETTLRAGQQALAQYDAHFGVRPRHTVDHTAQFIAGFDGNVMIDEVVTQSNDVLNGSSISTGAAEIFGKGIKVSDNNSFTFDATEFGVLMCISSFVPEADYNGSYAIDRNNRLFEPFDFFTPEFQNLGLEPVSLENFNGDNEESRNLSVVGYAPRYWNYKTAIDKIHGGFTGVEGGLTDVGLTNWVIPRQQLEQDAAFGMERKVLYVNPNSLNNIFALAYDGTVNRDYFLVNDYFDVKSIRPMSVLGLPSW